MATDPDRRRGDPEAVTEIRRGNGDGPGGPPGPPPPWWRENAWLWGSLLALLLIVVALILIFAVDWNGDDEGAATTETVAVPEVVGLSEDEAIGRLEGAGLEARVERQGGGDEVVDQDPGAGTEVEAGSVVALVVGGTETETVVETVTETETQTDTVEEEPQTAEVPDVTGQDFRNAVATMLDEGIVPNTYPVEGGDEQGAVVAQNPDPGTEVATGDPTRPVRLNVALGPGDRAEGEIPDLTGPELAEALAQCADAGYTCRTVARQAPSQEELGEVIDQEPAAGTSAPSLTQITLYVGR